MPTRSNATNRLASSGRGSSSGRAARQVLAPAAAALANHLGHMPNATVTSKMTPVPLDGYTYTKSLVLTGGHWDDPTIWSGATVPTSSDSVFVQAGASVTIRDQSAVALNLIVKGVLTFSRAANTRLTAATISVVDDGSWDQGTTASPIPATVDSEVVISEAVFSDSFDPERWGGGLRVTGASAHPTPGGPGVFRMCGSDRTPTFVRLGAEAHAGDTVLTLGISVVNKWRVGDVVDLPDTRHLDDSERAGAGWPNVLQYEKRTVAAIATDGLSITLDSALTYDHLGGRKADQTWDTQPLYPHVANFTRNVRVRSANPAGVRGHVVFMMRADVDVRHAEFKDLGRTLNSPTSPESQTVDSTTFNADGTVLHIGTNQVGRYPVHFHHYWGPVGGNNSTFPLSSPRQNQGVFVGNLVHNPSQFAAMFSARDTSTTAHWGVVNHASGWLYEQHNVVAEHAGALIVEEDGTEVNNIIEDNYMTRCYGTGDRLAGGFEGVSYFARNGNNRIRRNVANNYGGGVYCYGYNVFNYQLGGTDPVDHVSPGSITIPILPGTDMHSATADNVNAKSVVGCSIPFLDWTDNESYSGPSGMVYWWVGTFGPTPVAAGGTFTNQTAWHVWTYGVFSYDNNQVVADGLRVYGDNTRVIAAKGTVTPSQPIAIYTSDYPQFSTTYQNFRFEACAAALLSPDQCVDTTFTLRNGYNRGQTGVLQFPIMPQSGGTQTYGGRTVLVDNCKFDPLPGGAVAPIHLRFRDINGGYESLTDFNDNSFDPSSSYTNHIMAPETLQVTNYQQQSGVNFKVYYIQQDSAFVPPASSGTFVGSPHAGWTNQQLHDNYLPWDKTQVSAGVWTPVLKGATNSATPGLCVCGELMPAGTSITTYPEIHGRTK